MIENDTSLLIGAIASELKEQMAEEAADAMATQIAGQLESKFMIVPKPPAESPGTRAELGFLLPDLFGGPRRKAST